jgi:hypothetical protein
MIFADLGVLFVVVIGLAIFGSVIARSNYRRKNPPLTIEQQTALAEKELAEINRKIEGMD